MMEMDGLDSAKCQKSRIKDIMGIMGKFNGKRQNSYNYHLLHLSTNRAVAGLEDAEAELFIFKERGSGFSLGFRPIRPSVFDGARRKVVLRGEGYVRVGTDLVEFRQLQEVGIFSYLC